MNEVCTCYACGTEENLSSIEHDSETIPLCPECVEKHLKICFCCGENILTSEDDYTIDRAGEIYCESCRDDSLSFCEHCNEYSNSDNFTHIHDIGEYWCDDCAENQAYHCHDCGDWVSENHGDDTTMLCSHCYENDYFTCDDCGEVFNSSEMRSGDNGTYCPYCYEQNHATGVHNYSYEPDLNFLSSKHDNEKILPYLGFELEAGGLSDSTEKKRIADDISDDEETFYLKEDCSIPEYGFELVSHPITLKKHKELDWKTIFNHMSSSGMRSHDLGDSACGLHVHVSRNYLTPYKWLLIDWLVSKYQEKFEIISRRKANRWAAYKKNNGQPVKEIYGKSCGSRYQAVNFENRPTVEFRLFRGTLKYTTFMATLEIVDALVHWAKQVSISDILASKDAFYDFSKYILTHGELYANAVNYLNDKNLI